MKNLISAFAIGVMITFASCDRGTSGGPGATDPPAKEGIFGQSDNTFSLELPMMSTKLTQGESKVLSIAINRGTNFSEDVTLKLSGLPEGVTLEPGNALINHGDKETQLTLSAAHDAALGDFQVEVIGHPAKGGDAVAELNITIAERTPEETAKAAAESEQEMLDAKTASKQQQVDQLTVNYNDLVDRAVNAEGNVQKELDIKVEQAKATLDKAAIELAELKSASLNDVEKISDAVKDAFRKDIDEE
jgi:hypothetical protein